MILAVVLDDFGSGLVVLFGWVIEYFGRPSQRLKLS